MSKIKNGITYADAGVDIDAGNELVERIKPAAKRTARPGVMSGLGGFGALFDLKGAGYDDPILVSATDGVGTKLRIAIDTGNVDTIGVDLVAMCVNDLVCQGAEPLFFLDYFATGKLKLEEATRIIEGIAKGCEDSGCALIGGETAEMPGVYALGDYDLAGFAVGAAERGTLLDGSSIAPGHVVVGLESDGVHANGFSLVRKVLNDHTLPLDAAAPYATPANSLAEDLMRPTRIYVRPCLEAHRAGLIGGLAHITGGGLVTNPPRVLPEGCAVEIDVTAWTLPPVFRWLAERALMDPTDLAGTFNCGLGMLAYVAPDKAEEALRLFEAQGERPHVVGTVKERGDGPAVLFNGLDRWLP